MSIKKHITAFMLALACIAGVGMAPEAEAATRGEKTFGLHTGYISRNRSADIGIFFQYTFSSYFRLQPSADIVFRHNDRDAFLFDLNAQFPIGLNSQKVTLYPFAGLNFSSWNKHLTVPGVDGSDIFDMEGSSRANRFGVNLGAGFDMKVSSTMQISIEGGYTFVKSNSGFRILAGIGYVF